MKLQQLIYAVKVAECGSITEASRKLFVSQPSITAAISDLEKEMDVRIFDRTNKGVTVSEEGETFLGYARQVLERRPAGITLQGQVAANSSFQHLMPALFLRGKRIR